MMEELCQRFSILSGMISNNLDDLSLTNLKISNRNISKYLSEERFYWIRIIKSYRQNFTSYSEQWKKVIEKTPVDTLEELAAAVQEFFQSKPSRRTKKWRALHIAAKMGLLNLSKHIVKKTKDSSSGRSLMMAAGGGNFEVVQLLLENTKEVNLQNYQDQNKGRTPLHYAAEKGHFDVCQLLIKHGGNASLQTASGATPLHKAAQKGHLKVCKLLGDSMENKNPPNSSGLTPLHGAAKFGYLEICKYLMDKLDDKNPADNMGTTPLHYAADSGHLELCKFITSQIDTKNPANNQGTKPSQLFINTIVDLSNNEESTPSQIFIDAILDIFHFKIENE